ncbi:M1 family aminopeptidase [Dyadobacter arcticus]|uniref:Aminopeptidase N n=1 Tax=Dyadobacter arcticus TaxID=1078754 RepID=A0ABX0UQ02_9BACT|nr:M1 family aminopeptidase [Dyadobacter arcticus]NIJ55066.1 hypothetical protein [Dyadobacter arcticus]
MKPSLLLLVLITFSRTYAQKSEIFKGIGEIAEMEMRSHRNVIDASRIGSLTGASTNFDVKYYRCEWNVDPNIWQIAGKITTHFVMKSTDHVIAFDLADNLTVSTVEQRNISLPFTRSNNTITITFPASIPVDVKDSVSISYSGVPSSADAYFVTSTHGSGATLAPIMWTLSEPYGARNWWPCKNGLDDKADSIDVYITYPSAYKAASNGILTNETVAAGKRTSYWKHRYPIASYLVCFAVTNYLVFDHSLDILGDNVKMQTFCYPESQATFEAGGMAALNQIDFFSNLFEKYPFRKEKYGHVQFGYGGGMEHQTASFMGSMNESLMAHELAHQWFGDKITCGSWEDIWLNEGFATHLASMFMENKYPATAITNRKSEITFITSNTAGSVRVSDVNNINRIFNQRLSYYKGSHLLFMLRWILGEAVFKTAIKNYLQDPAIAYGFATTAMLKNHLETASGKNLNYFFDQWFTGEGFPTYHIDWYPSNNTVEVKLNQTTSHPSVGFFQLPVPLLFRNSVTNEEKLVTLNNISNGQVFSENLGFTADQVIFDPEAWLISRNNVLTKVSSSLPVTFSNFNAACSDNDVEVKWETSEEVNAAYFEVQKSSDAIQWYAIGQVEAAGNSQTKMVYSFNDIGAGTKQSYYRIAEKDYDGKEQYTRIVSSSCGNVSRLNVVLAPNPVKDRLIFNVDNQPENLSGSVYGINGIVADPRLSGLIIRDHNEIDVARLPSGLYILKLISKDQKTATSTRFLKE